MTKGKNRFPQIVLRFLTESNVPLPRATLTYVAGQIPPTAIAEWLQWATGQRKIGRSTVKLTVNIITM